MMPDDLSLTREPWGRFEGDVTTRWIDRTRLMELVDDFAYVDPFGIRWDAPTGWKIDGASIPRAFWTVIGSPFTGPYRRASVVHDVACDTESRPWQDAHRMFYNAMRCDESGEQLALIMYTAVYFFGPKWGPQREWPDLMPPGWAGVAAPTGQPEATAEDVEMVTALVESGGLERVDDVPAVKLRFDAGGVRLGVYR